jgi:homogentisate 1,2-dioxygenase
MSYYYKLGQIPHKRHTQFRQPDGSLYHEELMGLRGFSGAKSLLYHRRPPTEVSNIAGSCPVEISFADQGPLRHRLLNTASLPEQGDAIQGRVTLMANQDVTLSVARPSEPMSYWYRYAHGDEAIFVHEGTGTFESQFGTLQYGPGDYLVVPTGVMWRIVPDRQVSQRMLIIESAGGHIEPPRRYVSNSGQFLESAP